MWGCLCPAQTGCSLCAGHWSGDSLPQCTQDSFPRRHIGHAGYFLYKACLLPQNNEATFLGVAFKCSAVVFQFTFLAMFSLPSFQHTMCSNYMIAATASIYSVPSDSPAFVHVSLPLLKRGNSVCLENETLNFLCELSLTVPQLEFIVAPLF